MAESKSGMPGFQVKISIADKNIIGVRSYSVNGGIGFRHWRISPGFREGNRQAARRVYRAKKDVGDGEATLFAGKPGINDGADFRCPDARIRRANT